MWKQRRRWQTTALAGGGGFLMASMPLWLAASLAGTAVVAVWAVKCVRVGRSVDRYARYWAAPQGEPGGLLYVALGDSAAQGVGASSPERGYVGLLADRMRARTGMPVQIVNLSQSGATLHDLIRDQLPLLAKLRPDVVTVDIGGNDVLRYHPRRFGDDVCLLTGGLPQGAAVADVPYFMHGRWERRAADATAVLAGCVRANNLRSVPLHDAEQSRGWKAMLTDYAADWFHPNDRGHRVWADAFWSELIDHPALTDRVPTVASRRAR